MKRCFAGLLVTGLILLCGCQPEPQETPTTTSATTTTTTVTTTTAVPQDYDYLTGRKDMPVGASTRPVAVMYCNTRRSRPQRGISKASLYLEGEIDSGVTRIMAVFPSAESLPDGIGPVRSTRTHFVRMADALDTVLVHAGGSTAALARIKSDALADIDGCRSDGVAFWRDAVLRKKNGFDHSFVTGGSKLRSRIAAKKYRNNTTTKAPFTFSKTAAGSEPATALQAKIAPSQEVSFTYDKKKGVYLKQNDSLSHPTPHLDEDGTPITAANVIFLFARRYQEDKIHITYEMTSGDALLFTGGTARPIRWSRSDEQLMFYETGGSEAVVRPGKTYICLISTGSRSRAIYS